MPPKLKCCIISEEQSNPGLPLQPLGQRAPAGIHSRDAAPAEVWEGPAALQLRKCHLPWTECSGRWLGCRHLLSMPPTPPLIEKDSLVQGSTTEISLFSDDPDRRMLPPGVKSILLDYILFCACINVYYCVLFI